MYKIYDGIVHADESRKLRTLGLSDYFVVITEVSVPKPRQPSLLTTHTMSIHYFILSIMGLRAQVGHDQVSYINPLV